MSLNINYFSPRWGSSDLPLEDFLLKSKEEGFDGVEIAEFDDIAHDVNNVRKLFKKFGLKLIGQQWLPPEKEDAGSYLVRFEKQIRLVNSFSPIFINSHSGKDYYTFEENCEIFERAISLSEELQIPIYHETHRGRALFCTSTTRQFLSKYKNLNITADYSHWCVVSESLLEEQSEFLNEACQRAKHIHARVGNTQIPQVAHPGDEKNKDALESHLKWWQSIVEQHKKRGDNNLSITVEFGPPPYLQTLPFTQQPVADLWELNVFMKNYLQKKLDVS